MKKKCSTPDSHLKTLAGKRRQVWSGRARNTSAGLRKRDLVQNGKIVSRKKSLAARRAIKPLELWRECLHEAAMAYNRPFQIAAKGTAVYRYAKKRYIERIATGESTAIGRRATGWTRGRRAKTGPTTVRGLAGGRRRIATMGRTTGGRKVGRISGRRSGHTPVGRRSISRAATGRRNRRRRRSAPGRNAVRSPGRRSGRRATSRHMSGRRASAGRTAVGHRSRRSGIGRQSTTGHQRQAGQSQVATGRAIGSTTGLTSARTNNKHHSDCAICMGISNEPRKHCQCGHSFHARCLNRWLQTNETCPLCRDVC